MFYNSVLRTSDAKEILIYSNDSDLTILTLLCEIQTRHKICQFKINGIPKKSGIPSSFSGTRILQWTKNGQAGVYSDTKKCLVYFYI